jgi:hypothetical protein
LVQELHVAFGIARQNAAAFGRMHQARRTPVATKASRTTQEALRGRCRSRPGRRNRESSRSSSGSSRCHVRHCAPRTKSARRRRAECSGRATRLSQQTRGSRRSASRQTADRARATGKSTARPSGSSTRSRASRGSR